jgi:hypothetical protein
MLILAQASDPQGEQFPWLPPPATDLAFGAAGINRRPCLVLLLEGADDDDQASAVGEMCSAASAYQANGGGDFLFFYALATNPLSSQIRELTSLKPRPQPQLLVVDVPSGGQFHYAKKVGTTGEVSACELLELVEGHGGGSLGMQPFSEKKSRL